MRVLLVLVYESPQSLCPMLRNNFQVGMIIFLKANMIENRKTELESYLGAYVLIIKDKNFDILEWCKINAIQYPLLSTIARDILAIPVSIIAFESAFSTRVRVVSPLHNRLHS